MSKACSKCGVVKELEGFYKQVGGKDGRRPDCKECHKAWSRAYAVSDRGRAVKRKHANSPRGLRKKSDYIKSERGKAARVKSITNYRKRYPMKDAAQRKAQYEVSRGRLPHPATIPCEEGPAGCSGRHEYHHDSYRVEDRAVVRCMCRRHHRAWHAANTPLPPDGDHPSGGLASSEEGEAA